MTKSKISLILFASLISLGINAQTFVGGNFGLNVTHSVTDNSQTNPPSNNTFQFNITPFAGKFLSEKFAVGGAFNFSYLIDKESSSIDTKSTNTKIGIGPFIRYYPLKWNKLSVFCQGNLGVNLSFISDNVGGTETNNPKTTQIYLNCFPGISYDISDRISLETSLNFAKLGMSYDITKNGTSTFTNYNFGFGGALNNIITPGAVTIGAIIKF
jgi:hypothetical protein